MDTPQDRTSSKTTPTVWLVSRQLYIDTGIGCIVVVSGKAMDERHVRSGLVEVCVEFQSDLHPDDHSRRQLGHPCGAYH
eukprot:6172701-Amphidinium_carterae.1